MVRSERIGQTVLRSIVTMKTEDPAFLPGCARVPATPDGGAFASGMY